MKNKIKVIFNEIDLRMDIKFDLITFFFLHFIIINIFLYNIYDIARQCDKKWWHGHMIGCLVGHLTEGALTEMNGRTQLIAKHTYRAQI